MIQILIPERGNQHDGFLGKAEQYTQMKLNYY